MLFKKIVFFSNFVLFLKIVLFKNVIQKIVLLKKCVIQKICVILKKCFQKHQIRSLKKRNEILGICFCKNLGLFGKICMKKWFQMKVSIKTKIFWNEQENNIFNGNESYFMKIKKERICLFFHSIMFLFCFILSYTLCKITLA